jgi:pimeloyl-ACP methyl ester carboxylesterase
MSTTLHVPHLGGVDVAYRTSGDLKSGKPVLVLAHSFMTSSGLYDAQFQSKAVTDTATLIAFDLLGHGKTRTKSENFTYWDMAITILQALEKLQVKEFYVLGTSQGGWIVIRTALLAPTQVR